MVSCRYDMLMNNQQIFEYLERINMVLRAEEWKIGRNYGLQPIQLQMLAYLKRCNRYSHTPAAVTLYFNLTKGTVSQSLKVLETRGYITRQRDSADGRKVHLLLTPSGEEVVREAHPPALFRQLQLPQDNLLEQLQALLRQLQYANSLASFGICHTCQHFRQSVSSYQCGLTQEHLSVNEIDLICLEHNPAS